MPVRCALVVFSRHPEVLRSIWIGVIALTLAVPAALITYGYTYNTHTSSTAGGPVTLGLCVALALGFDAALWIAFVLVLAVRSARRSPQAS